MFTLLLHTLEENKHIPLLTTGDKERIYQELHSKIKLARNSPSIIQMKHSDFTETKLVALDLDGTLTRAEFMKELAIHSPFQKELTTLTDSAIEGEEEWEENFRKRIKLIEGVESDIADRIAQEIPYSPRAKEFIALLKEQNISIVIITGAYQGLAESIGKKLGIKEIYSSHFEIKDGRFTGKLSSPFLTPEAKSQKLLQVLASKGLSPNQCTAIGDSYNDLPMLLSAGQALIYHSIQDTPLPLTALLPFI